MDGNCGVPVAGKPYVFQQDDAPAHIIQNWFSDNVDMFLRNSGLSTAQI